MHEAYTGAGGQAKLIAYGPFKGDAHRTFSDRDGFAVWWPETESFLAALGMPTAVLPRSVGDDPALAALTDATRIPFVKDNCVRTYNQFLVPIIRARTRSHPTEAAATPMAAKTRKSARLNSVRSAPRTRASSTRWTIRWCGTEPWEAAGGRPQTRMDTGVAGDDTLLFDAF